MLPGGEASSGGDVLEINWNHKELQEIPRNCKKSKGIVRNHKEL